jgi:hypothetical protein
MILVSEHNVRLRNWLFFFVFDLCLISSSCTDREPQNGFSLTGQEGASHRHTEINSSIAVLGTWDYVRSNGPSKCESMVSNALEEPHSNSVINFIPTHGFIIGPQPPDKIGISAEIPESDEKMDELTWGDRICYRTGESECVKPTPEMILEFETGMAQCMAKVFGAGKSVALTPHLDDGERRGRWRNLHVIDPAPGNDWDCRKHTDSYYCAFLKPLAFAVKKARGTSNGAVYFAGQGEMGATVFAYPEKYHKALRSIKKLLTPQEEKSQVQVGVSINFNKIAGFYPLHATPIDGMKSLLKGIDFLGVSSYPKLVIDHRGIVDPGQFDQIMDSLNAEIKQKGIDLKKDASHLDFHFSEVGIGGSKDYIAIAKTFQDTLANTWAGIHGQFNPRKNPWSNPITRKSGEIFYCTLGAYLSGHTNYRWKISQAFLWNLASWDIQGIYHTSRALDDEDAGSYAVPQIINFISRYNKTGDASCPSIMPTRKES